jgi:protoporphyrin/coproporphyrin ferrochelatase
VKSSFDAVLIVAFGGPQGPDDIRPFLGNVLRGRRVAPERVEAVAHHYELFGGVSPLTELTMKQAEGLRRRLAEQGRPLPVYVGMRNWHPYLHQTFEQMSRDGVRRVIAFVAAAHRSYSGCLQYKENVAEARSALSAAGLRDVEVTYVGDWHLHDGFVEANAAHIMAALDQLPADSRDRAEVVFTAHSIPVSMAARYPYERQVRETAAAVARRLDMTSRTTAVVFQSRSGRPEDPWLGPDVCDYLKDARTRGVPAAVLSPIGFICDHVEVLYDLDVEAAQVCRDLDLPMARAAAVNDHPRFIDTMADVVLGTADLYAGRRPLEVTK